MNASLKTAWQIMLFKKGPEDLPYNTTDLINITVALLVIAAAISIAAGQAVLGVKLTLVMVVNAAMLYALLSARGLINRFLKMFLAYQAVALIFSLFEIGVLLLALGRELSPGILLPILALSIWRLAVEGRVCQHGFDIHLVSGILLAFVISMMRFLAVSFW